MESRFDECVGTTMSVPSLRERRAVSISPSTRMRSEMRGNCERRVHALRVEEHRQRHGQHLGGELIDRRSELPGDVAGISERELAERLGLLLLRGSADRARQLVPVTVRAEIELGAPLLQALHLEVCGLVQEVLEAVVARSPRLGHLLADDALAHSWMMVSRSSMK